MRRALDDEIDDRAAGRPGGQPEALAGVADLDAEGGLQEVQGLIDEELLQPFQIADRKGLAEAERLLDHLAHVRRNRQRQIGRRIARREIEKGEDDEADEQEGRDRDQYAPDRILKHRTTFSLLLERRALR